MSNIEKIRQEIERQRSFIEGLFIDGDNSFYEGQDDAYNHLLAFIDSLPEENNPEPYNPVYDEDYLNEKIAKATKSWKGVDVDAMLAECRGYEEKPSEDLEEAAENLFETIEIQEHENIFEDTFKKIFIAGAERQKAKMMKDAVEGEIVKDITNKLAVTAKNINLDGFKFGDKVKIIIVKED